MSSKLGQTPLMQAVTVGDPALVRLLVAKGADVNAREDPLGILYGRAKFTGDKAAMRDIERQRKSPRASGTSVLEMARRKGNHEIVDLLTKAGAKQ